MVAMPIVINQATATRQSYQLVTVSSRTHHSAAHSPSFLESKNPPLTAMEKTYSV
jgi:hypothetical protein